ncbi:MAG: Coenzyme F420 hydrogenase/dehydrogenase, beta subunit C-terminal domain [Pseudomonadota bacterium]|nr:Coenzyme F420 hydrogenase/dehydrogenase, beta subunit C-terminal domain [Pseudomonadota bacterium]
MNKKLSDSVIAGGYCIGCGACAALENAEYKITRTEFGLQEAELIEPGERSGSALPFVAAEKVCPFSDAARDEDELNRIFYSDAPHNKRHIGRHWATYAGSVADDELRAVASSGGIGRWLERKLLEEGLVDGVVHVIPTPNNSGQPLFEFTIVSSAEAVAQGARSAYYPTPMHEVLKQVRGLQGRYLFTGVPCFAKALKSLCLEDTVLGERIKYVVGIVCGHMKSEAYAELIAWQMGVKPERLEQIDFRGKVDGIKASTKQNIVTAGGKDHKEFSKDLFGTGYGLGLFKPKACDFCDDVLAEVADISIGDAWLPEYVQDSRGSSIVIVRNRELGEIVARGIAQGELQLDSLSADAILQSQEGGLRHRTDGLECRLQALKGKEEWMPRKRVKPGWRTRFKHRGGLYDLRYELAMLSHSAFRDAKENDSLDDFIASMTPLVERQKQLLKKEKNKGKSSRLLAKLKKKVGLK